MIVSMAPTDTEGNVPYHDFEDLLYSARHNTIRGSILASQASELERYLCAVLRQ